MMKNALLFIAALLVLSCEEKKEPFPQKVIDHGLQSEYNFAKYILSNLNVDKDHNMGVYLSETGTVDTIKLVSCELSFYDLTVEEGQTWYSFFYKYKDRMVHVFGDKSPIDWYSYILFVNNQPEDVGISLSSGSPHKLLRADHMAFGYSSNILIKNSEDFFFPHVRENWDEVHPWLKNYLEENVSEFHLND